MKPELLKLKKLKLFSKNSSISQINSVFSCKKTKLKLKKSYQICYGATLKLIENQFGLTAAYETKKKLNLQKFQP